MGNYHITIQATGPHLNTEPAQEDADRLADELVDKLLSAGHEVERAIITSGEREVVLYPRSPQPGNDEDTPASGVSTGPDGAAGTGTDPAPPPAPEGTGATTTPPPSEPGSSKPPEEPPAS